VLGECSLVNRYAYPHRYFDLFIFTIFKPLKSLRFPAVQDRSKSLSLRAGSKPPRSLFTLARATNDPTPAGNTEAAVY
jgi:hypothetical protein